MRKTEIVITGDASKLEKQSAPTQTLSSSPYWTGSAHGERFVCLFCGCYWLTASGLRMHLESEHPEVWIVEASG